MPLRHDEQENEEHYDDRSSQDGDGSSLGGRINFSQAKLYGRAMELQKLQTVFNKLTESSSSSTKSSEEAKLSNSEAQVALLAGMSGTGKSRLVQTFAQDLEKSKVPHLFVTGKYGEHQGSDPYSAIVDAIGKLCNELVSSSDPEELAQIKGTLNQAVGSDEASTLTDLIPDLAQLIGEEGTSTMNISKENAVNHLKYVFQNFMKAFCIRQRPLILFLDDLQWADEESLDLLSSLLLDHTLQYFLFIGAFRSNEVDEDHRLFHKVSAISTHKEIERIDLTSLSSADIREFIADSLNLEPQEAQTLTEVVYGKTKGNMFFTIQSLEELRQKHALYYDVISFRWEWNLTKVELETTLSDDVVEALKSKISRLDENLQHALVLMAYTRSTIDIRTLTLLMDAEGCPVSQREMARLLDKAVLKGLLLNCIGSDDYTFAHDRIEQAAYMSVPPGEDRYQLRIRIANSLLECLGKSSKSEVHHDWMMFVAADHLNSVPFPGKDRIELARMNLEAGEKSASRSALKVAANYFRKGLDTLEKVDSPWESHYDLSLGLFRATAEVENALGNFTVGARLSQTVLDKALALKDKLSTYITYSAALRRQSKHGEAILLLQEAATSLDVFPRKFHVFHIAKYFRAAKAYLRKYSDEDIVDFPKVEDPERVIATELLFIMAGDAHLGRRIPTFLLSILKGVCMAFSEGLNPHTAMMFGYFGVVLSQFGDYDGAKRLGRLARRLLHEFGGKQLESIVELLLTNWIFPWSTPINESLSNAERGHKAGLACGDLQFSTYNLATYCLFHAFGGTCLDEVRTLTVGVNTELERRKDLMMLEWMMPITDFVAHLMGCGDKPLDWTEFEMPASDVSSPENILPIYVYRLQLAYYFGRIEVAYKVSELLDASFKQEASTTCTHVANKFFFSCLTASWMARKTGKRTYLNQAKKALSELEKIMEKKGRMFWHRCLLMQADVKACSSRTPVKVKGAYDSAIIGAREANFIHDEALANELAGRYFLRTQQDLLAKEYLADARDLYERWGAHAKVHQLVDECSSHLDPQSRSSSLVNRRSRMMSSEIMHDIMSRSGESDTEVLSVDMGLVALGHRDNENTGEGSLSPAPDENKGVDGDEPSDISLLETPYVRNQKLLVDNAIHTFQSQPLT